MKRATTIAVQDGQFVKYCVEVNAAGQRSFPTAEFGRAMPASGRANRNSFTNLAFHSSRRASSRTVMWLSRDALEPVTREEASGLLPTLFTDSDCYRNPLWRANTQGRHWVIDTITLIERCLIPSPWLLPSLLTMFRTELGTVRVDGKQAFIWTQFQHSASAKGAAQAWALVPSACSLEIVAAMTHWLDHRGRAKDLDLVAASIRRGGVLHLPNAWPERQVKLQGVDVGDMTITTSLTFESMPLVPWTSAYVVSNALAHGLVFTAASEGPQAIKPPEPAKWITGFISPPSALSLKRALEQDDLSRLRQHATALGRGSPNSSTRRGTEALILRTLNPRRAEYQRFRAIVLFLFRTEATIRFTARIRIVEALTPAGVLRTQFTVGALSFTVADPHLREAIESLLDERVEAARAQHPGGPRASKRYRGLKPDTPLFPTHNGQAYPDGVRNTSEGPGLALVFQRLLRRAGLHTHSSHSTRRLRGAPFLMGFKRKAE